MRAAHLALRGGGSAGAHEAILARRASGRVGWIRARAGRPHPRARKVNVALAPVPSCEPSRPVPATVRTPEDTQIRTDRLWCVGCEPRILPCAAEVVLERTRRYLLDVHRVESDGFVPAPDALIPELGR